MISNLKQVTTIRRINNSAVTIPKNILLPSYLDDKLSKSNKEDLFRDIKGGFLNYQVLFTISNITSSNIFDYLENIQQFIDGLEDKKIYTILVNAISKESYESSSILPRALFIHRKSSAKQFVYILHSLLLSYEYKYQYDESSNLIISGRIWYSVDEVNDIKYKEVEKRVNYIMKDYLFQDKSLSSLFKTINKYYKSIHIKLHPGMIDELDVITGSDSYSLYNLDSILSNSKLLVFYHNNEHLYYLLENGKVLFSWRDVIQSEEIEGVHDILREFEDLIILFKKDGSYEVNVKYKFDSLVESEMSPFYNEKIGCIDFETYSVNGDGKQTVYAGAWLANGEVHKFILGDPGCETSYSLVEQLFSSIFKSKYTDYTFYIHNLSNFDSIFILDALTRFNYNVKAIVKEDNSIVSIKIINILENDNSKGVLNKNKRKSKITVLDSNLMIKGSLRDLCKGFECDIQKGYFPYTFVKNSTLNYVGEIPSKKYFEDLSLDNYNQLSLDFKDKNWSVKTETLKYLELDLRSLLEVLLKFSNIVYNEYGLNITDFKTISSLSLHIYLSNFYDQKYNIKLIKGRLEKEIRNAYYGGLVHLNCNKIDKGYFYDMNSQYPSAMLNDMPVGDPILSTDTNLNSYFGFCYAKIIPPKDLDILVIPHKNDQGEVYYPNEPFTGLYFSELLKNCLEYGYKVEITGGMKFERGIGVFNDFVQTIYEQRLQAKLEGNNSLQLTNKLILNSLYGRMGMKNIENKTEIISKEKAENLFKNKNILFVSELNEKLIVKYNKNIDSDIVKLINNFDSNNSKTKEIAGLNKIRGVTSSVAIAAAVTAYAQISMMKFKNIPGNKCLYSDTDSILLESPLSSSFVDSKILGKMKLEHVISKGYFISKKLYAFKNTKGEIIIKSKGLKKGLLDFDKFVLLSQGKSLTVDTVVFIKNMREGTVNIIKRPYTIKGNQDIVSKSLVLYKKENFSIIPYKSPNLNIIAYINKRNLKDIPIISLPGSVYLFSFPLLYINELSILDNIKIDRILTSINNLEKDDKIADRILLDIKNILDFLKILKSVRPPVTIIPKKFNRILESKLFYIYGEAGNKIRNILIKYLDNLDLFDIIEVIMNKYGSKKFFKKIPISIDKRVIKFKFISYDLEILISIAFVGKFKYKIKKNEIFKHKITLNINLIEEKKRIKVIKHTNIIKTYDLNPENISFIKTAVADSLTK